MLFIRDNQIKSRCSKQTNQRIHCPESSRILKLECRQAHYIIRDLTQEETNAMMTLTLMIQTSMHMTKKLARKNSFGAMILCNSSTRIVLTSSKNQMSFSNTIETSSTISLLLTTLCQSFQSCQLQSRLILK